MTQNNTEKDLALLQGTWEQVGHEVDGVADAADKNSAAGTLAIFRGNEFSVVGPDGKVVLQGTLRLDATTIPRQATWIDGTGPDKGKQLPGIYNLSEDNFVFAAANDKNSVQPTDFRTEAGQHLRRFVRRNTRHH